MSKVKCRWADKGHDQLLTAFHYYGCESNRKLTIKACYSTLTADRHRVNDCVRDSKGSYIGKLSVCVASD